jgi:hypothetical protein
LGKYFSAVEVLGPLETPGTVAVVIEGVERSDNAKEWYVDFFRGDYTDENQYSEVWLAEQMYALAFRNNICEDGKKELSRLRVFDKWTMLSVAMDEDNNFGKIYRQLVEFTTEGRSPRSEFPEGFEHYMSWPPGYLNQNPTKPYAAK